MVAEALRKDNKEREKTEGVEEQKRERDASMWKVREKLSVAEES